MISKNLSKLMTHNNPQIEKAQEHQAGYIPKNYTQANHIQTTENKTTEKQSLEEIQRETICLTYRGMRLRTEVDFSEIMLARREESELFES